MLTRGLVIDEPWIGLILAGRKTWEMRSRDTKVRGPIGLVRKGSGKVFGIADLVDSRAPLPAREYARHEQFHCIPQDRQAGAIAGGWTRPWVLTNVRALRTPVRYRHRPGAVIWVTLEPEVTAQIRSNDPLGHA